MHQTKGVTNLVRHNGEVNSSSNRLEDLFWAQVAVLVLLSKTEKRCVSELSNKHVVLHEELLKHLMTLTIESTAKWAELFPTLIK